MASRLAKSALGAARARPAVAPRVIPSLGSLTAVRASSSTPTPDPQSKAQSIVNSLPGSTLASKTAILSSAAALSVAAISNELYVVNEETVVVVAALTVFYGVLKYGGPAYKEWAEGQIAKQKEILGSARAEHTQAVAKRIDDVKQLSGVVDITRQLFAVSKETAQLEAEHYELEQRTALAAEAKRALDSWVNYEAQIKQREQQELASTVISRINKELQNPKVLQQILQQSVTDVEKIVAKK